LKPLVDAFTLLTIIPLPFGSGKESPSSRFAPFFFPVVGLLIGLGAAALFTLVDELLPQNLAAALVLVAIVLVAGALHIDGLADFFDGLFGGRDPESRLRIMKQPDVGAFGATAIVLTLAIDWIALSSLTPESIWIVLPVVGLVSRSAPLVIMSFTRYVSQNGLGADYTTIPKLALIVVILVTLVASAVIGGGPALSIAVGGVITAALVGLVAIKRIGGANGDVYGAGVELTVAVCLVGASGVIDAGGLFEPIWATL
jgi:adenosylcobinamide-GDP ribazoletransferase